MSLSPSEQALLLALQQVSEQLDRIEVAQKHNDPHQTLQTHLANLSHATNLHIQAMDTHKHGHDTQVRALTEMGAHIDKAWGVHLETLATRTREAELHHTKLDSRIQSLDKSSRRMESVLSWLTLKLGLGMVLVVAMSAGVMWWMRPPDVTSQVLEEAEAGRLYRKLLSHLTDDEHSLILERLFSPDTTQPLQATPLNNEKLNSPPKKKTTKRSK